MAQKQIDYSVVIAVYNSENTLEELCERIANVFKAISGNYEIIMVDDGSKDNSWGKMEELHKEASRIKIIKLMRNFGQHNAIMCGFHFVHGEYVITIDDDLQNPPEEIPKLIDAMKKGKYDVVYGEYIKKKHSFFRNIGSSIVQFVYKKVFGVKRGISAFRIIKREIIQDMIKYDKNYVFIDGIIALYTINIGHVNVTHHDRERGKSGYSLKKLLKLSLNMITNFSIFPLQLASLLGFVFAIFGFSIALFYFFRKVVYGIPVPGYTSLIVVITIFAGVQLITLGIIGEYIGRIHLNLNKNPQYIIKNRLTD